jgi:nucleotide-binding universal stress UspA family protein
MNTALFASIVVAVDASEGARRAIAFAVRLARDHTSRLHFVNVVDWVPIACEMGAAGPMLSAGAVVESLREAGELLLTEARTIATDAGIDAVTRIEEGEPAQAVLAYAQTVGATVLVMGTHGRSGLSHLMLGSVAERVIHARQLPVITVRPVAALTTDSQRCISHVLVGVDDSEPAACALDVVWRLPAEDRRTLVFCTVAESEAMRAAAERIADRAHLAAVSHNVQATDLVVSGHAAEAIVRVARERAVDLIVVGTHARRHLERMVLGSVAEQVLRTAPVPVLVVNSAVPVPVAAGTPVVAFA